MPSQGPNSPGTVVSDNTVGTHVWTNPGNASASDDARAVAGGTSGDTEFLKATNFGFSIPGGATIDGIEVAIERRRSSGSGVVDNAVQTVKAGVVGAENKASGSAWPTSDTVATYGGAADLWLRGWNPTDINASNFGVVLSAAVTSANAEVDFISITVTYTEPPPPPVIPPRPAVAAAPFCPGWVTD